MMLESALQVMTTLMGFIFALYIVMQPHPVLATYALIALAITTAIKWWIYQAGFFSLILLLIYMGAVLVFFLFVVMTLSQDIKNLSIKVSNKIFGIYAGMSMITIFYYAQKSYEAQSNRYLMINSAEGLSQIVLQDSTMLLQWIGLFLLLAMLIAILLLIKPSGIKKD